MLIDHDTEMEPVDIAAQAGMVGGNVPPTLEQLDIFCGSLPLEICPVLF